LFVGVDVVFFSSLLQCVWCMLRSHSSTVQKVLSLLLESVVTVCSHLLAKTHLVSECITFLFCCFSISRLEILIGPPIWVTCPRLFS
jgi:hypothetical protein